MEIVELPDTSSIGSARSECRLSPEVISDYGNLLVQEAARWNAPFGFEPSVRFSSEGLDRNRFLITATSDTLGFQSREWFDQFAQRCAVPNEWHAEIDEQLVNAPFVHLGFEASADDLIYKLYLEFAIHASAAHSGKPYRLYTGYKWSVLRPDRQFVTYYDWLPQATWPEIEAEIREIVTPGQEASELAATSATDRSIAARFLEAIWPTLVKQTVSLPRFMVVSEPHSSRRSFDLNVYELELPVHRLRAPLETLCREFGIPMVEWSSFYDQSGHRDLGHIAAGKQRNGSEFVTIYYGAQSYDA